MGGKNFGLTASVVSPHFEQYPSNLLSIAELPIDRNLDTQELNRKRLFARTKTVRIFWSMFKSLVTKLEPEYWSTHCGIDGYLFLLFQRRFIRLTFWLTVISLSLTFIMNTILPVGALIAGKSKSEGQEFLFSESFSAWLD